MTSQFLKIRKKKHRELSQIGDEYVISSGEDSLFDNKNLLSDDKDSIKESLYYMSEGLDIKLTNKEKHPASQKKKSKNDNILIANSLNLGYYIVAPLLIGVFFGFWLDKVLKTKPVFVLIFLGGGLIGSFYNLWKITKEH